MNYKICKCVIVVKSGHLDLVTVKLDHILCNIKEHRHCNLTLHTVAHQNCCVENSPQNQQCLLKN